LKDYRRAVSDLRDAAHLDPQDLLDTHFRLAKLLATCPDLKIRNGPEAIEHARISCNATEWKDSFCLTVLAAAYAETGNFEEAIKWQRRAVELADESYRENLRTSLKLYKKGERYREK
jgi:tetratricopeptide (TPR) repeat protein